MNSHYLSSKLGRIALALFFLVGIGMVASTTVQAQQWPYGQDPYGRDRDRDYNRDRDYRRNDRYGRNGNVSQIAFNQGYQDGTYTGSNDAQRGQNYNPQRSHFYRNGHGGYGGYANNGRYGRYDSQQAYREGFLRGYDEGFRRYGGYNNNRRRGGYGRLPFPW